MAGITQDPWGLEQDESPRVCLEAARRHDAFWQQAFSRENYFRRGLDYEDYAPAYCVGYIGHAQYGGSFEDAEKSLLSNWVRIKGDSRLSLDEARMAMRAAWDHAAGVVPQEQRQAEAAPEPVRARLGRIAAAWKQELELRLLGARPGMAARSGHASLARR